MKTSEFIRTASLEKATATIKITLFELEATSQVGFITVVANTLVAGTTTEPPKYKLHDEQFLPV